MHELSMVTSIVNNVKEEASRHNVKKVLEVQIAIGEFTFLNAEQLEYLYGVLIKDTILEGSELVINTIKGVVKCELCGYQGGVPVLQDELHGMISSFGCPECEKGTVQIVEGTGVSISNIKVSK